MYKLTRKEAAKKLWVSTRSIDRYIKSGKIRAKKDGKIVYVNNSDIENLLPSGKKQEIIIPKQKSSKEEKKHKKDKKQEKVEILNKEEKILVKNIKIKEDFTFDIYKDLKKEINKKDEMINELSIRLGRAEEIASNSINLIDYKKSQFLLEESRNHLNNEISELKTEKNVLEKKLRYEKNSNIILIFISIILFMLASIIWFLEI